ncbi:MAG: tetratricopeptide repeat protein [Bacteroidales bacterium]|jgi:tetratricopeptide (TPR) repeat protein|nr:tetratricopeptide repeat protein [Bacteroidales bacterium]
MVRIIIHIVVITIGVFFLGGCKPQPEAPQLLADAQRFMENNPDSAMLLIDSLFYPEKSLRHEDYMRYLVLHVQARYKTNRPVADDTLVFRARDHYSDRLDKEPRMAALAWFYSGCVYRERGDYEKAMLHYKKAETYATGTADTALQGLIQYNLGDLFAVQDLFSKAQENYKAAARFYGEHPEKEAYSLSAVGRMFLLDKNPDSAFFYFQKGLEAAKPTNDKVLQSLLAQNTGVAYQQIGQYAEAERYFRQSYRYNRDKEDQARSYLNLAKLFAQTEQLDSAAFYAGKLKNSVESSDDNYLKASAYKFLADWEKARGRDNEAFAYQNKRIHSLNRIMDDRKDQSVYEIEQKYNYGQKQNFYNQRFIRFQQWLMGLMGVLLVVVVSLLFLFWRMLKERAAKLRMQENVNMLRATTIDLLSVEEESRLKEKVLKETLQWKLDVLKNTMHLRYMMSEREQKTYQPLFDSLDKILFDQNTKTPGMDIRQTVEHLNPSLRLFIRQQYPTLSETEYNVCLLSYASLSVQEVAFVLNQSEHTVYKARTRLNKKIGSDFYSVLRRALSL